MMIVNNTVKTVTPELEALFYMAKSTISRWIAAVFCLAFFTGMSSPAQSEAFYSHDDLRQTIEKFVQASTADLATPPQVKIGHIDDRLKLSACELPAEAFLPDGSRLQGRTTIGVRCNGKQPWSIFVPATIVTIQKVAVTSTPLMRGQLISESDINFEERDISSIPSRHYFSDKAPIIGKVLKRPLQAGNIIQGSYLEMPTLVHRGQTVSILAETNGLVVKMNGKSLMDGAEGDLIKVENPNSKKIIHGTVTSSGEVKVNL